MNSLIWYKSKLQSKLELLILKKLNEIERTNDNTKIIIQD